MIENRIINKLGNEADDHPTSRTMFSSPVSWNDSGANLVVFHNGQLIIKDQDYMVIDQNTIQLSNDAAANDQVAMQITNIISETNLVSLDRVSKKVEGKAQTSTKKSIYEESIKSNFIIHVDEIWATDIPPDPQDAISIAVAFEYDTLELTKDVTVEDDKGWYASSNGQISGRLVNWIPPKFGQGFTIRLYDANNEEIPSSDSMGWKWDYQAGYLFIESENTYPTPFKVKGYRYTGSFASDTQSSGGTSFWKSPVPTESALPTFGNIDGEIRLTLDTNTLYVWDEVHQSWLSTTYGSEKFRDPVATYTDLPFENSTDGEIRLVLDSNSLYRFNSTLNLWEDIVNDHDHDERYYTKTEVDNLLDDKADVNHNHDSRYYNKLEVDEKTRWRPSVPTPDDLPPYTENNNGDVILTRSDNEVWRWDSSIAPQGKWIPIIASGLTWKPPVDSIADLPTFDNTTGDVRLVLDEGFTYFWDGVEWHQIGIGEHHHDDLYYSKDEIHQLVRWKPPVTDRFSLPPVGNTNGDVRLTLDDSSVYRWDGDEWRIITASPRWREPVNDITNLPTTGNIEGDTRIVKNNRLIYQWNGTEWVIISNPPHDHNDIYYTKNELDNGQLDNRYYTRQEVLDFFNIDTGHNHDGINSKRIDYNHLLNIPYFYWKNPVINFSDLSGTGNQPGDTRIVLNEANAYVWNGIAWVLVNSGAFALVNHDHDNRYYTQLQVDQIINDLLTNINAELALKADVNHDHDDLYYRKHEVYDLIDDRFDTISGHDHDGVNSKRISYWNLIDIPPDNAHDHDDRYYTKIQHQTPGDSLVHWENVFAKPDLANGNWKTPVQTVDDLPMTGNNVDDIRLVLDDSDIYEWNGTEWVFIGHWANQYVAYWREPVDHYIDLPRTMNVHGDVRLVIEENNLYRWDTPTQEWISISTFMKSTAAQVYLNGLLMTEGIEYVRIKDTMIKYLQPLSIHGGDRVTLIITGDFYLRQDFTAHAGQEFFGISNKFVRKDIEIHAPTLDVIADDTFVVGSDQLLVWVNGLMQIRGEHYIETTNKSIRFFEQLKEFDRVTLIISGLNQGHGMYIREDQTATVGQRIFNLNNFFRVNSKRLLVYLNGHLQKMNDDYTELSNSTIELATACTEFDQLTFLIFDADDVGGGCCNAEDIVLGVPTDGTYFDGLLPLIPEMKVNDAVDDINEVLLGLAPDQPIPITSQPLETDLQLYSGYVSGGNINYETSPGTFHNYLTEENNFYLFTSNDVGFSDADSGVLDLYVNGAKVDSFNLLAAFVENNRNTNQTSSSYGIASAGANGNSGKTGTNGAIRNSLNDYISIMSVGKYNNFFLWQKGRVRINIYQTIMRKGYNTVKLVHVVKGQNRESQLFKFFYDDAGSRPTLSTDLYLENTNIVSQKYVSGVRYFSIGDEFRIMFTSFGVFNNTYSLVPVELDMPGLQPYEIEYNDPDIQGPSNTPLVGEFFDYKGDLVLNEFNEYSVNAVMNIKTRDPFGYGEERNTKSVNRLVNTYTNGSTDLIEYFRDEQFRLPADDYNSLILNRQGQWNSQNHLINGQALIFDNKLMYPNIDFRNIYRPQQTANYSLFTGPQTYYRAFYKPVARNNGTFIIRHITPAELFSNAILIDIKLPAQTGWLSLNSYYDEVVFNGEDGDGCLLNIDGENYSYSTGLFSTANSAYTIVIRITLPNSSAPSIEYMELQL